MEIHFSLRPAIPEDLSTVAQMEARVAAVAWGEDHFRSELSKPYSSFLLMTDDDTDSKIAGYIIFWLMFDECQILNIAVDIPYRGIGLAKKMVRKSAQLSIQRGIKRIILEVRKSNLVAIQLYQGLGFHISHIRKGFYGNGEDAYQMALSLVPDLIQF